MLPATRKNYFRQKTVLLRLRCSFSDVKDSVRSKHLLNPSHARSAKYAFCLEPSKRTLSQSITGHKLSLNGSDLESSFASRVQSHHNAFSERMQVVERCMIINLFCHGVVASIMSAGKQMTLSSRLTHNKKSPKDSDLKNEGLLLLKYQVSVIDELKLKSEFRHL